MEDKTQTITILRGDDPYAEPIKDEITVYPVGQLAVHWADHWNIDPLSQLTITHILSGLAVFHLPPHTLTFTEAENLATEINATIDIDGLWKRHALTPEIGLALAKIVNRHLQETGHGDCQFIGKRSVYLRLVMGDDNANGY